MIKNVQNVTRLQNELAMVNIGGFQRKTSKKMGDSENKLGNYG